jgi:hypothetical protein
MKKRRNKENKTTKVILSTDKTIQKVKFLGIIKRFWSIIPIIAVLISLYLALNPSISVAPNTMIKNDDNAILTPFTVSNNGHFSIYNVKCSCAPKYILSSNYVNIASLNGDYSSVFTASNMIAKKIVAGGEYTEYMPLSVLANSGLNPTKADIAIMVSFRIIKFVPWEFKRKYRFITTKAKNESVVWIQQPFN